MKANIVAFKTKIVASYRSTVVVFNGALIVALQFVDSMQSTLPLTERYLPQGLSEWLGYICAANIILRFRTLGK